MRHLPRLVTIAIAVAAVPLLAVPPIVLAQSPPAGNASMQGRRLFLADGCYECHGTVGQGSSAGPRLAPEPLPTELIIGYIRDPKGQMPPYSPKVISDADIADIHAYLASIRKPDVTLPGGK